MPEIKDSHTLSLGSVPTFMSSPLHGEIDFGSDLILTRDNGEENAGEFEGGEFVGGAGSFPAIVGVRGRGGIDFKPWQQEGDWQCPNPSCTNINFSFRGICNRCGTARPAGNLAASAGGVGCGRSRGRGPGDAGCRSVRGFGGPPSLFGPSDWNCPMCGNINWAKRTKCNICNTTKPGYNEGGAREGRAGGYKEFDESEFEETKRRRREMEEDDGEMYDEFGNLKKKFRAKARVGDSQIAAGLATGGMGKAGWDMERLRVVEQSKEKNKDRSDQDFVADRRVRDCVQNMERARNSQGGHEGERDAQRGRGVEWSVRDRREFLVQDHDTDTISGEAWAWERFSAKSLGNKEYVLESENDQLGVGLRGRKRLRERDRFLD